MTYNPPVNAVFDFRRPASGTPRKVFPRMYESIANASSGVSNSTNHVFPTSLTISFAGHFASLNRSEISYSTKIETIFTVKQKSKDDIVSTHTD